MKPPRSLVLVLGPHRSGTSLATRLAGLSGAVLLPDPLLARGGDANPDGFWEYQNLTRLNELVFRRLGAHWSAPPVPEEVTQRDYQDLVGRAALWWARRRFNGVEGTVLWKDPRLCVLAALWKEALGPVLFHAVMVVRKPMEAAISLWRRNGLEIDVGLALWSAYTLAALTTARAVPSLIVPFDRLIGDPTSYVSRLAAAMMEAGLSIMAKQPETATSFVRQELYRSKTDPISAVSSELGRASERLYQDLMELEQEGAFRVIDLRGHDLLDEMSAPIIRQRRALLTVRIQESLKSAERFRSGARYAGYAAVGWIRGGRIKQSEL